MDFVVHYLIHSYVESRQPSCLCIQKFSENPLLTRMIAMANVYALKICLLTWEIWQKISEVATDLKFCTQLGSDDLMCSYLSKYL